ncbi:transmembrane protein 69-like [Solea solea]|uniref:transmembrane protein 69-like n=1 Tax=Solea solea TaxID=90069 RepID=UPI00272C934F|nr:transmembrane protein 69-like [Solea solea]
MMLAIIVRRNTSAAQKFLPWLGPAHRCWTSGLTGASYHGSLQTCRASSAEKDIGLAACSPVHGFIKSRPFLLTQSYVSPFLVRNQNFHSSAVRQKKRQQPEPPPRELDLLRYDMKDLWKGPKPAIYLGFAGLVPFVVPPLLMSVTGSYLPDLAYAQLAYGASITSFLGGARWGFALPETSPAKPDWINLANSVIPSLFAWAAMLLSESIIPAATTIIMGLGISLHYDLSLLPTYPSWFKALRSIFTAVAFLSLVSTLIINNMYP